MTPAGEHGTEPHSYVECSMKCATLRGVLIFVHVWIAEILHPSLLGRHGAQ